ncbi:MAG: hypothetical protein PUC50_05225 [Bacteroidales bacterium]|nr:hypothetical protein [Bacteroidales bacterium]
MKLIVLYGPANSGKTTSLKKVYEVLKHINIRETNVFKYLDINFYLDFLDKLVLNRQLTKNEINECLEKSTPEYVPTEYDENSIENLPTSIPETGEVTLKEEYRDILVKESKSIEQIEDLLLGIDTEGDYGYKQTRPSLYERLEELYNKNCEIIICACTKRNKKKPIQCVIDFVKNYHATAYIIPTSSLPCPNGQKQNVARVLSTLSRII